MYFGIHNQIFSFDFQFHLADAAALCFQPLSGFSLRVDSSDRLQYNLYYLSESKNALMAKKSKSSDTYVIPFAFGYDFQPLSCQVYGQVANCTLHSNFRASANL